MEPKAAQRKTSDGTLAVCCSMLRAIGPSLCSVRACVSGFVFNMFSGKISGFLSQFWNRNKVFETGSLFVSSPDLIGSGLPGRQNIFHHPETVENSKYLPRPELVLFRGPIRRDFYPT